MLSVTHFFKMFNYDACLHIHVQINVISVKKIIFEAVDAISFSFIEKQIDRSTNQIVNKSS